MSLVSEGLGRSMSLVSVERVNSTGEVMSFSG